MPDTDTGQEWGVVKGGGGLPTRRLAQKVATGPHPNTASNITGTFLKVPVQVLILA